MRARALGPGKALGLRCPDNGELTPVAQVWALQGYPLREVRVVPRFLSIGSRRSVPDVPPGQASKMHTGTLDQRSPHRLAPPISLPYSPGNVHVMAANRISLVWQDMSNTRS